MSIRRTERLTGTAVALEGLAGRGLEALEARTLLTAMFDLREYLPMDSRDTWTYVDTLDKTRTGTTVTLRDSVYTFTSGTASSTFQFRFSVDDVGGLRVLSQTRTDKKGLINEVNYQNASTPDGLSLLPVIVAAGERETYQQSVTGVQTTPLRDSWSGDASGQAVVGNIESVATRAGSFKALKITWTGAFTQNGSLGWTGQGATTQTLWLAQNLGIVRFSFKQSEQNTFRKARTDTFDLSLKDATLLNLVSGFSVKGGLGLQPVFFRSTATSALNGTDFGSLAVGLGSVYSTFTLTNTTRFPVMLAGLPGNKLDVRITGEGAADFKIVNAGSWRIAAKGKTLFTVVFTPSKVGARVAEVSIAGGAGQTPFVFRISGTGI